MERPFWDYWSDDNGFDRPRFMGNYLATRGITRLIGARARIDRIVCRLPRGSVLETNICSTPTKRAAQLHQHDRTTAVFRFLLETVTPRRVYAHSNEPIRYLERLTGCRDFAGGVPQVAVHEGHTFRLIATAGPLYRMPFAAAEALGDDLARWLRSST